MLKPILSPSLMCADLLNLGGCLDELKAGGAQLLHIDIMDGHFVPNYTLGPDFVRAVRGAQAANLDIHLMVEAPEDAVGKFSPAPGDHISAHVEATAHIDRTLRLINDFGAAPGAAINPGTPVHMLEPILELIAFVVVMTVNPGFAGQKLVPYTIDKIAQVRKLLDDAGMKDKRIEVDGNVSLENAPLMRVAGADIFVAGTSSVFKPGLTITQGLRALWDAVSG